MAPRRKNPQIIARPSPCGREKNYASRFAGARAMSVPKDILDLVGAVTSNTEAIAVATVVRADYGSGPQAGARAVIAADGTFSEDWIGGYAFAAVFRAAADALADGQPRLIRIGLRKKVLSRARQVGMEVLVEPMLPRPELIIAGATPVAFALCDLARRLGFFVTIWAPEKDRAGFDEADRLADDPAPPSLCANPYLVVATQGPGDRAALRAFARMNAGYLAVVGPPARVASLKSGLLRTGVPAPVVEAIRAAGFDIGAVTPEEIALSVVAEMVAIRRGRPACGA
jgi:xanthine dehydrogenase accessory factor